MEVLIAAAAAALISFGVYLLRGGTLLRLVLGLTLASNGVNLLIFAMGRLSHRHPPLIGTGATPPPDPAGNPLAQALVLTSLVIEFGLLALALALARRLEDSAHELGTDAARGAGRLRGPEPRRRLAP